MRNQATKATRAQVEHHIERQRALGESLIDDDDEPTWFELIVTGIIFIAAVTMFVWLSR
jgi:hypothetical protein